MKSNTPSSSVSESFQLLYWKAYLEHEAKGRKSSREGLAHRAGKTFCESNDFPLGMSLLEVSLLGWQQKWQEAATTFADLDISACQAIGHFILGRIRHAQRDYGRAIEACNQAMEHPEARVAGFTWLNLGRASFGQRDFAGASQHYKPAPPQSMHGSTRSGLVQLGACFEGSKISPRFSASK